MSFGFSNGIRVFRGCRALLAPSKSSAAVPAAIKSKEKAPPSSDDVVSAAVPKPKIKRVTTRSTGILKVVEVSPALSNFLGVSEVSRTNAVKQIWSYIKLNNLQVSTFLPLLSMYLIAYDTIVVSREMSCYLRFLLNGLIGQLI